MHITQGTFSYLPPFTDEQIRAQIEYALQNEWSLAIEHTDDPHPRNSYWDMWGQPLFDVADADKGRLGELEAGLNAAVDGDDEATFTSALAAA